MTIAQPAGQVTDRPGTSVAVESVPRRRRPRAWWLAGGLALLAAAAVVSAASVDSDSGTDLVHLARAVADDLARLRWQFTAVVALFAAVHCLATAIAARAAAGLPLPLGETVLVQLAAAAANRLAPAGVGGSALTARYFTRRGMPAPRAVGAVGALACLARWPTCSFCAGWCWPAPGSGWPAPPTCCGG